MDLLNQRLLTSKSALTAAQDQVKRLEADVGEREMVRELAVRNLDVARGARDALREFLGKGYQANAQLHSHAPRSPLIPVRDRSVVKVDSAVVVARPFSGDNNNVAAPVNQNVAPNPPVSLASTTSNKPTQKKPPRPMIKDTALETFGRNHPEITEPWTEEALQTIKAGHVAVETLLGVDDKYQARVSVKCLDHP